MDYDEKEYILENRRERRVSEHERTAPGIMQEQSKNVVIAILALATLFNHQYHRAFCCAASWTPSTIGLFMK